MANKKVLKRNKAKKMVLGVCAGIGDYFGVDATLIRLGAVLVAVFTGFVPVIVVYVLAAVVMPE